MISPDSNQSSRWPRSNISWVAATATDSAMKPNQSSRRPGWRSLSGTKARQPSTATTPNGTTTKNTQRQL